MLQILLVLSLVLFSNGFSTSARADERWLAYYSDKASPQDFNAYKLLVLDSDYHPELAPLSEHGKTLLGYLSLGEAAQHRYYFDEVRKEGVLLNENSHWEGSYSVDIRERSWTERVIYELIPSLLHQGFDGVFLDTLDSPLHLEWKDPKRYEGMAEAAIRLVRTIRRHYPHIKIMLNRAYDILPRVASDIDIVLGESVYADYDFEKKSYQRVPEQLYQQQLSYLKEAVRYNPSLKVFTLDYWEADDHKGIAAIYREQRANGFIPYVATITLDRIVPEPRK